MIMTSKTILTFINKYVPKNIQYFNSVTELKYYYWNSGVILVQYIEINNKDTSHSYLGYMYSIQDCYQDYFTLYSQL